MTHLDIYNRSYGKKKGHESNWQFDSRPRNVRNRPDFHACKWCATHRLKALDESYNFALDLVLIGGLNMKLQPHKVERVLTLGVLGLPFGSPKTKRHLDVALTERCIVYYMGEGGGFRRVRAMVSFVSSKSPVVCLSTKGGRGFCLVWNLAQRGRALHLYFGIDFSNNLLLATIHHPSLHKGKFMF